MRTIEESSRILFTAVSQGTIKLPFATHAKKCSRFRTKSLQFICKNNKSGSRYFWLRCAESRDASTTHVYKRSQFVPDHSNRSSERRKKSVALSKYVMYDSVAAFHGGKKTRRSNDASDNFSASSHLICGVPVMEETCGDSRISSIESREESPWSDCYGRAHVSTRAIRRSGSRNFSLLPSLRFFSSTSPLRSGFFASSHRPELPKTAPFISPLFSFELQKLAREDHCSTWIVSVSSAMVTEWDMKFQEEVPWQVESWSAGLEMYTMGRNRSVESFFYSKGRHVFWK